ncbi:ABC transporter ATP-binding protein [Thermochromatium tepidum]|jgi:Predicted ABC-type transport system involved in lysophospholipase L1 biosynthesis, ATPase component|uniref:ATP-binding cassette domain-containing protein n=1 Tax=Thermochromatium tepidum ATCC 43061 TaxID=316276 RepID=A0A6I6E4G1_THETI|nr:ABC transporter ATP-binding protein [Thermochromatium tepidum]QGU33875.1 ATP-binding cassette domain-containing protein [Thermochromatium tepidum ATCC 43061]
MSTDPVVSQAIGLVKHVTGPSGGLTILAGVDLNVHAGEAVAILGASGSGKSTLLGLLAGLDDPTAGEVWLCGQRVDRLDEDGRAELRAGRVGFVFQNFQLLPTLTARENVLLPLELTGAPDADCRAEEALARVGLSARARHYPHQLSGGEQQRVAIARAYAPRPSVLFADEPTGNLDQTTGERIIELLLELRQETARESGSGTALVLVTHDPALAGRCDRRLRMQDGRLESLA